MGATSRRCTWGSRSLHAHLSNHPDGISLVSKKYWDVTKEHAKKRRVIITPSGIRTALTLGELGPAGGSALFLTSEDSSGCLTAFFISKEGILMK